MRRILSKIVSGLLSILFILFIGTFDVSAQGDGCPPDGVTGSTCPWTTMQIGYNYQSCPLYLEICLRCCEGRVEYYIKRRSFPFPGCMPAFNTLSDYQAFELAMDNILWVDVLFYLQNSGQTPCITSMPQCLDDINCTPGTVYMATFNAPCKVWVLATRNNENGVPTQYADLTTCEQSILCKAEYRVCKTAGNYCRKLVSSLTPVIPTTCSSSIPQMPAPINEPSPFDRCFSAGCVFNP